MITIILLFVVAGEPAASSNTVELMDKVAKRLILKELRNGHGLIRMSDDQIVLQKFGQFGTVLETTYQGRLGEIRRIVGDALKKFAKRPGKRS